MALFLGVDIGTSSSKAVITNENGDLIEQASRPHAVERPREGFVEMDPREWWTAFTELPRLVTREGRYRIDAVGVSGMGPCLALTTEVGEPTRAAILYGVDTRSTRQIDYLTRELGDNEIVRRCGSRLSTQAVGPKILWVREEQPDVYSESRRFFTTSSWLAWKLTGAYVLDHHSASQCAPLYDLGEAAWNDEWAEMIAPTVGLPELRWSTDQAGAVTTAASRATGLRPGTPVTVGTIDAWAEAASVGADDPGSLMIMYGTTMFLVAATESRIVSPPLWSTQGVRAGSSSLAGGMATSGAVLEWVRTLVGSASHGDLEKDAQRSGPGAAGLLLLPYFAGERTPVDDPQARGVIAGLTLSHSGGDLYRAALESTAFGVRHHLESFNAGGATTTRAVAVGGGAASRLWTQIVSDIAGVEQAIPSITVGASYGSARLAAELLGVEQTRSWNPTHRTVSPNVDAGHHERSFRRYQALYSATRDIVHELSI